MDELNHLADAAMNAAEDLKRFSEAIAPLVPMGFVPDEVNDFIMKLKIDKDPSHGAGSNPGTYGMYPFPLLATISGDKEFSAMAVNRVEPAYTTFAKYLDRKAESVIMALDFPQSRDMESDFILVVYRVNSDPDVRLVAIPYDTESGATSLMVADGETLRKIASDMKDFGINVVFNA